MKKAFTLVELAVVLVIIGLIAGMGIKGKTLIDSAKVLSDISKMKNIETKIKMYYMENNVGVPFMNVNGWGVNSAIFGLDPTEKMMTISSSPNVYFILGVRDDTPGIGFQYPTPPSPAVLAITAWDLDTGAMDRFFPPVLACTLEVTLDDKNLTAGNGRGDILYDGGSPLNYDDCLRNKHPQGAGYPGFYYHWIVYKY